MMNTNNMKPENDYRNLGSCPSLTGNIAVFQCFVTRRNSCWSITSKELIKRRIIEAEDWLQRECSRYGHRVCFKNFNYEDLIIDSIPTGPDSPYAISFLPNVVKSIGYSESDYNNTLMNQASNFQCEKLLFLLIINGKGRNFAIPYSKALHDYKSHNYYIEPCILFKDYWSLDSEIYSSSIAHEILHVCGAWDLYADKLTGQTADVQERATELLPNSIMRSVPYNINDAIKDDLTAWLVGINANHKSWYDSFEPQKK